MNIDSRSYRPYSKPLNFSVQYISLINYILEGLARYEGLLLGLWPLAEVFFGCSSKKRLFWPILGFFWWSVVILITFSSKIIMP